MANEPGIKRWDFYKQDEELPYFYTQGFLSGIRASGAGIKIWSIVHIFNCIHYKSRLAEYSVKIIFQQFTVYFCHDGLENSWLK